MSENHHNTAGEWQRKLLPFMMKTILFLAVFFFIASLVQITYLHYLISHRPQFRSDEVLAPLESRSSSASAELLQATRLKAAILLESNQLDNQYHQATITLMGNLWTSYIGFVTGMILAFVGATFILGKLKESGSELTSKMSFSELTLKSGSPGLVLATLGTLLMLSTIFTHHKLDVKTQAIYFRDMPQSNISDAPPLPPPLLPEPTDSLPQKP